MGHLFKKVKRKKKLKLFHVVVFLPLILLSFTFFMFFLMDDFWIYAKLMLLDNSSFNSLRRDESLSSSGGFNYTNSGVPGTSDYGSNSLNMMLINAVSGGYYADLLEILRDTCNGSLLQDGYFENNEGTWPNGRSDFKTVPLTVPLVVSLVETGTCSDKVSPAWFFDPSDYNVDTGFTLKNYNSKFIKDKGITSFANDYHLDGHMGEKNTTHLGPYQFSKGWFDLDASGTVKADTVSRFWPSKLCGYGYTSGTLRNGRTSKDKDHGEIDVHYYPDNIALFLEYSFYNLSHGNRIAFPKNLSDAAYTLGTYALHGGGEATWKRYCHNTVNPTDNRQQAMGISCAAWEQLATLLNQSLPYVYAHGDEVGISWLTQQVWLGWSTTTMLLNGGFVRENTSANRILSNFNAQPQWRRGALLAYRFWTKNDNATEADVKKMLVSLQATTLDMNLYGAVEESKSYSVWLINPNVNALGTNTPSIARWDSQALFGGPTALAAGPYAYWRILTVAGVECTLEDVIKDMSGQGGGDLINGILSVDVGAGGRAIAYRMAQICYPTLNQGSSNYKEKFKEKHGKYPWSGASPSGVICGSDIYIQVHKKVITDDAFYASCDRGVCTAVRWSGADDNFCPGAVEQQYIYLLGESQKSDGRWVEVNWGGDISRLQPGDIFIRSDKYDIKNGLKKGPSACGHIVCFIGDEIAREVWPESVTKNTVGHASYNDRPPALGNYYSQAKNNTGLSTFHVFRNVRPMEESKYSDFVPAG